MLEPDEDFSPARGSSPLEVSGTGPVFAPGTDPAPALGAAERLQLESSAGAPEVAFNRTPAGDRTDRELRQSMAYRMFVGPDGLRAGWSILVFFAIFAVLAVPLQLALTRLFHLSHRGAPARPLMMILAEGGTVIILAVATLIMAMIERRPFLSYGYSGPHKLRYFLWGILSGVAALSALVATLRFSGLLGFDGQMLHGLPAWEYGLVWAFGFLLVALAEESMLRGYVQFTLARGVGFWWAALLLSVGFGMLHLGNPGESPIGIFSAAAIGLVFCISLWLTKSLWWAVGVHAAWDWTQSYLFGVADSGMMVAGHLFATHPVGSLLWSGGRTGPEGSLYIIPVTLILAGGAWFGFKPGPAKTDVPLEEAA